MPALRRRPVTYSPPGRYHVALDRHGARILDGWWDDPDTADGKFDGLQAQHEEHAGTRLRLTEWDAGREWPLREWPPTPAAAAGAGRPGGAASRRRTG